MTWDSTNVARLREKTRRRHRLGRVGLYLSAIGFSLFAVFPFSWAVISMFKRSNDLYSRDNNPFWFNEPPTLQHIQYLFRETNYLTFVRNTLIVGLVVTAVTLAFSLPTAYALARLRLKWGERMGIAIFLVYLIPPTLLFIPMTQMINFLGIQETLWSLILVYPTITIPISSWLLMGYFKSIPMDIEEQAMVDGYSRLGAITRVVMPLMFPGIVAVIVFAFTLSAHEFIYALSFNKASAVKTIATGVPTELIRGDVFFWQSLQSAVVLVAIPIALVFNAFLDRFIAGFTMGAVKG